VKNRGVRAEYDDSGSIGRRYARSDEIGTPYCVTVDHQTLKDDAVTVRNRDTTAQIRVSLAELHDVLRSLFCGRKRFDEFSGAD